MHEALADYAQILLQWHKTFHLLGQQNEQDFVSLHLLDSISGALLLAEQRLIVQGGQVQIVDVGSGLGLPGIPLALCFSLWPQEFDPQEFQFFLVEPVARRAKILRSMLAELGLAAKVCEHPVEQWGKWQTQADHQMFVAETAQRIVTCRAFRPLDKKSWKQLLQPLKSIDETGTKTGVLLYKGNWKTAKSELEALQLIAQSQNLFKLPQCDHQRSLFYIDTTNLAKLP